MCTYGRNTSFVLQSDLGPQIWCLWGISGEYPQRVNCIHRMEPVHAVITPPVEESPCRQSFMVHGRIVHIDMADRSSGLIYVSATPVCRA